MYDTQNFQRSVDQFSIILPLSVVYVPQKFCDIYGVSKYGELLLIAEVFIQHLSNMAPGNQNRLSGMRNFFSLKQRTLPENYPEINEGNFIISDESMKARQIIFKLCYHHLLSVWVCIRLPKIPKLVRELESATLFQEIRIHCSSNVVNSRAVLIGNRI